MSTNNVTANADKLIAEIEDCKAELHGLEQKLRALQKACEHSFSGGEIYRKCEKCSKIEVLYY